MIVTLTHRQFQAARYYASERHRGYLDAAATDDKDRVVDMPPAGWRSLQWLLEHEAFTRTGRGRNLAETEGAGARSALTTITRGIARLAVHPAMRSEVVVGVSTEEFLVWSVDGMGQHWQPWPHRWFPQAILLVPVYEPGQVVAVGVKRMRVPEGITWWRTTRYWGDITEHEGWLLDGSDDGLLDEDQPTVPAEDEVGLEHQSQ